MQHIEEILRNVKSRILSPTDEQTTSETQKPEDNSWREFQKYTLEFYGDNLNSKKFKKEASLYFQEKLGSYRSGFDVIWEMIPIIKQLGARTHKAFDTEYGIQAFDKAIDDRTYRRQREAHQDTIPPKGDAHEPKSDHHKPFDDNPSNSSDNILPQPKTAKEVVATHIYARFCLGDRRAVYR